MGAPMIPRPMKPSLSGESDAVLRDDNDLPELGARFESGERVVRGRDVGHRPVAREQEGRPSQLGDLATTPISIETATPFDLSLRGTESNEGLRLELEYATKHTFDNDSSKNNAQASRSIASRKKDVRFRAPSDKQSTNTRTGVK